MLISRILLLSFGLLSRLCNTTQLHEVAGIQRHPFYVSVTEIQENTKDKILEIACKIFTYDFENDLGKAGTCKHRACNGKGHTQKHTTCKS